MKKRRAYLGFLAVQLLLPACVLLGYGMGKKFVLFSEGLYLICVCALSLWLTVRIRNQEEFSRMGIPGLLASLIHGLFLLFVIPWWPSTVTAVLVIVCGWLVFAETPGGWQKVVCQIFSLLLTFLLLLIIPFWLFAAAMGSNETVLELDSPGGDFTAQVIRSDQGALGGDTLVEVRDNRRSVPVLIGSFVSSRRVYRGEWYEWETIRLDWEEEDVLRLNDTVCSVRDEDIALITKTAGELGIGIRNAVVLEASDSHGGFHGDGLEIIKLQGDITSMDGEYWHELPLPEVAEEIPGYLAIDEAVPEKGRWFFCDRHLQSSDRADFTQTLTRASCNFTFAVWDGEILTCYRIDT